MTTAEQKTVDQLFQSLQQMRAENDKFKQHITDHVATLSAQVDKKHAPIYMEQDILSTVQQAIGKAIEETLIGYSSPLSKLTLEVVNSRSTELRNIITSSFDHVILLPEFKASIINAFSHKVSRAIISNNDGLFDKVSSELKQDQVFKSKMTLAVATVVEECLKKQ